MYYNIDDFSYLTVNFPYICMTSNSQIYGRFSLSQIDVQWRHWRMLQMKTPLGQVFEAMMEKQKNIFQMSDSWWQKKIIYIWHYIIDVIKKHQQKNQNKTKQNKTTKQTKTKTKATFNNRLKKKLSLQLFPNLQYIAFVSIFVRNATIQTGKWAL